MSRLQSGLGETAVERPFINLAALKTLPVSRLASVT